MIRVFVAAAPAVFRAGLQALLAAQPGIEIAAEPESADVLVTDDEDAIPELPYVLVAARPPAASVDELLRNGAKAVVPPDATPEELAAAVQAVAAGLVALHPAYVEALIAPASPVHSSDTLTARETEVLAMLAEGLGNKTIAWKLGISEHTVKFHVASILGKLGAGSRTEAVTVGIRRGLIML